MSDALTLRGKVFINESPSMASEESEPERGTAAPAAFGMVAFDIETMGLDPTIHPVTAVCFYGAMDGARPGQQVICPAHAEAGHDSSSGSHIVRTYIFKNEDPAVDKALREECMALLDSAKSLCAFNGVRFDIPFLQTAWGVPAARVHSWVVKTFDVYEACRMGLNATFSLDRLLKANNLESKTGSGLHAIQLAKDKKWQALGDYCMQDTRLTYLVSSQQTILLPLHTVRQKHLVIDRGASGLFVLW